MCTCITYENGDFYFGRNLDLDCSFGEKVTVTPRNFLLNFCKTPGVDHHYAMIGMASAADSFPLYAEAMNEKGLCMAGLNFPGNAIYQEVCGEGIEVASFEIIPWILSRCSTVAQAREYLSKMRIINTSFSPQMPPAPLHWMLADRENCLVIEAVRHGLKVYDNPFGVLTNNPPFDYHLMNMNNYLNLTSQRPENRFSQKVDLKPYAQGMGALGLPGDASSASRFVRAAFFKCNSVSKKDEQSNVSQFFHILDGVAMIRGSVITGDGKYDITTYSCCMNPRTGMYYYKTYDDSHVSQVDMYGEDLDGRALVFA